MQSDVFLADLFPKGATSKIVVRSGDTLMLPSGWIHAVYASSDATLQRRCGSDLCLVVIGIPRKTRWCLVATLYIPER